MPRRAPPTAIRRHTKRDYPVEQVRRFLEPGPVVLVSSAWNGERGLMTLGWHMMLGWNRVGTCISAGTHSFDLVRRSGQCVINLPTEALLDTLIRVGNCSGREGDKFDRFDLATVPGRRVDAPVIEQCHSAFECSLLEARTTARCDLFVWEVVHAQVAPVPRRPRTVHYRGNGEFMVSGREVVRRRLFRPEMLPP